MYKLNRRVTIYRYDTVQNEFGGLTPLQTGSWTKWAEAEDREGTPNRDYMQGQWVYDQSFIFRYEPARKLRSNDMLFYDNGFYKINSIQIRKEGHKWHEYVRASKVDTNINSDAPMDTDNIKVYNEAAIQDGDTQFTVSVLIGKTVFAAFKDGIQFVTITTGVPADKEVLFNSSTGQLTWSVGFAENEIFTILYY